MHFLSIKILSDNFFKTSVIFLFLTIISYPYYKDVFNLFFISDDVVAIYYATETLREIFLENKYSAVFYTPLAVLSLKPDFLIFGFNPLPYHIHNYIILILIAYMFYKTIYSYTENHLSAFIPAILILFSLSSIQIVSWIVLRQYLYPALLSLIIIYVFIKYTPSTKNNNFILLGLLLLLSEIAFLFKEQFMTLPFALALLAKGSFRERFFKTYPFFIILFLHFLIRLYMLKGFGGYIGTTFDLTTYLSNIYKSFLFTAELMFGYKFFALAVIAPLLIFSFRKLIFFLLLWIVILAIQFQGMFAFSDDYLRYWFVPALLMFSIFSLSVASIKKNFLRIAYILVLCLFFSLNTYNKAGDVKILQQKEALFFETVSHAIVNNKFSESYIFFFNEHEISKSPYVKRINSIYSEKLNVKTYPTFMPADFLYIFPELLSTIKCSSNQFEMKNDEISPITSIYFDEKIRKIRDMFVPVNTTIKLTEGEIIINCNTPHKRIIAYVITRFTKDKEGDTGFFYDKLILPYTSVIKLKSFTRLKYSEVVQKRNVHLNQGKIWLINDNELEASTSFPSNALVLFSCLTIDDKVTQPSDILFLKNNL